MHSRYGSAITVGISADDAITGGGSGDGIKMYGSTIPLCLVRCQNHGPVVLLV